MSRSLKAQNSVLKSRRIDRSQRSLFDESYESVSQRQRSSTFVPNMSLPVHRWFRFSAGFSSEWVESVIRGFSKPPRVLDPFAGSATTLIAAEAVGAVSYGLEAHPFIARVGRAKLAWRTDPEEYLCKIRQLRQIAHAVTPQVDHYPRLIRQCYDESTLSELDVLRRAYERIQDDSSASELVWLTFVSILRRVARVGTAPWQYILPNKISKPYCVAGAFDERVQMIHDDMEVGRTIRGPRSHLIQGDARTCHEVPQKFANLVITSPPYANNYDYADATRLEMSFMGEITGWGDLQEKVRKYLIRSCSQHVPESAVDLAEVLSTPEIRPIRAELSEVCQQLAEVRKTRGGKKTYHLMVACYFRDLAQTWKALRWVCDTPSTICFVVGDSAPYGIYVPTIPWLGTLALAAGFHSYTFEKTRDRNIKWKNRKHRVPLQEGRLWVEG